MWHYPQPILKTLCPLRPLRLPFSLTWQQFRENTERGKILRPHAFRLMLSLSSIPREEIIPGDLRKQSIGEHVLFTGDQAIDFLSGLVEAWLQEICRTTSDRLLLSQDFVFDLIADRARWFAIQPHDIVFCLHRHDGIAFSRHDIERRLRAAKDRK